MKQVAATVILQSIDQRFDRALAELTKNINEFLREHPEAYSTSPIQDLSDDSNYVFIQQWMYQAVVEV